MADAPITIYTTPTCGFCHMAKEYFKSKDITYDEKDVTKDAEAYREIMEKSGQLGVPVIDISGSIVIGFDKPKIDEAIAEHKLA